MALYSNAHFSRASKTGMKLFPIEVREYAFVRNSKKITVSNAKLKVLQGELNDESAVMEAIQGSDAVIWCVGIPMKKKYEVMK